MKSARLLPHSTAAAASIAALAGADAARIARAARAYAVRRARGEALRALRSDLAPRSGDLVLARVTKLGQHFRLHLPNGRSKSLWPGDEIVVAYADRYAPSQFEAHVPSELGPCHLAASGGIAARVVASNAKLGKRPTELEPIGLICADAAAPAWNVADFAARDLPHAPRTITTLAVVGSAMDSGKTSALAHLAKGVSRLGVRVGYAKLTGTAAGGDPWLLVDAGADPVLDFTDLGFASTSRIATPVLERVCGQLVLQLQRAGAEVALLEIADGLFQPETAALLVSPRVRALLDGTLYASVDALGAAHGASLLRAQGHRLLGLTGMLATAPLLVREAQAATDLSVYDRSELSDPSVAAKLLAAARELRS
jgi:molybdopterin-guanine dinucleotide biosynthesis protein